MTVRKKKREKNRKKKKENDNLYDRGKGCAAQLKEKS